MSQSSPPTWLLWTWAIMISVVTLILWRVWCLSHTCSFRTTNFLAIYPIFRKNRNWWYLTDRATLWPARSRLCCCCQGYRYFYITLFPAVSREISFVRWRHHYVILTCTVSECDQQYVNGKCTVTRWLDITFDNRCFEQQHYRCHDDRDSASKCTDMWFCG